MAGVCMETTVWLYNALTRRKEPLQPLDPGRVRMYVCGPTVHGYAHIGNIRPILLFDTLFRLLRHKYGEENVTYVRNITDIDDKINRRAEHEGVSIDVVTKETIQQFHHDLAALGVCEPTVEPRATDHIGDMIELIEHLIDSGFAYEAEGHVLFSPTEMNVAHEAHGILPRYGALSGRSLSEMRAGARIEIAAYKRQPTDFILWKPSSPNLPGWESPWGRGRPGWHIECSAMSRRYLGKTFDIHGGGIDLIFPHHENEIAQSCCAFSVPRMAQIWMHNSLLRLEGRKMSKSLGNFLTVNQLLRKWPPQVLRMQMLMTHYRQPIDWSEARCREAMTILERWHSLSVDEDEKLQLGAVPLNVIEALCDDINTPAVLKELHKLSVQATDCFSARRALTAAGRFLGILEDKKSSWEVWRPMAHATLDETRIEAMLSERLAARDAGEWSRADLIREELESMGLILKDSKEPETGKFVTRWDVRRF
ncbi:MAG: cysteine--tRNA ligase [Alphaproteobacteria bacterium]|nr:cysteine--tRNA ligase [Alphaproteobacteria bacterium]